MGSGTVVAETGPNKIIGTVVRGFHYDTFVSHSYSHRRVVGGERGVE